MTRSLPHTTKLFLTAEDALTLHDILQPGYPQLDAVKQRLAKWKKSYNKDIVALAANPCPVSTGDTVELVRDWGSTQYGHKIGARGRIFSIWWSSPRNKPFRYGFTIDFNDGSRCGAFELSDFKKI